MKNSKMLKRVVSIILTVLMLVSMFSVSVSANTNGFIRSYGITADSTVVDPIADSAFTSGVKTINDVLNAADDTEVTVLGQVLYKYGNYDSQNSTIIGDVIDGKIVTIQIYNSLDGAAVGDIVKVSGKLSPYGGVKQIGSASFEKVGTAKAIPPIEVESFEGLNSDDYVSQIVKIKNVTLGTYNNNGSTTLTDSKGATMPAYRAATYPEGVEAGEVVDVIACASKYNTTYQLRVGSKTNYIVTNDTKAPVFELPEFAQVAVGVDYTVSITCNDNVGVTSLKMTYTINGKSETVDMEFNETLNKFQYTIPGSAIVAGVTAIELVFEASDEAKNTAKSEKSVVEVVDLPRIDSVKPAANSATYDEKRPEISFTYSNEGKNPTLELYLDGKKVATTNKYIPTADLSEGKHEVKAVLTREDKKSVERVWSFTVGEPTYKTYWGQLHSHTAEYSDGTGTLEQAYEYAMNEAKNLDFLAVTDHSNYFDDKAGTAFGDITDPTKGLMSADGTKTKWQEAKDTAAHYNEMSDDFVALYGYEMTWSGQYGHMNSFNTKGFVSRNNSIYTVKNGPGLTAYYELLKESGKDTISMFNHPGTTFGTFEDFAHYDPGIDELVNLIEVGNGEGAIGGSAYFPSYEYYQLALDKGWHVAPTNNQDNHKGKWGDSNTARSCVITDNFTEEGIYQAMRDRAMFATEDDNFNVIYTLNDQLMGSILSEKPTEVRIRAELSDPDSSDEIGTVSVIVNGGIIVATKTFEENSAVYEVTLPNDYSYYYLKIVQADGDIIVTAPVWTSDVAKVGITSIEKDTIIDVLDEEITISTKVFNYEQEELKLNSVKYDVDGTIVKEITKDLPVIASSTETALEFKYTPKVLGAQTVTVYIDANLGDVQYLFNTNIKLDVYDASELINVAIDYGHANFYVSGNYAGSDTAFIELCAQNNIRAHYLKDEITYDSIKDMKFVLLSVPFNGFEKEIGADNLYTESELAALKKYAENGGNFIVTSKSDRGTPKDENENAALISNQILEVIGAKSRFGDGIVVDNEMKENEAYRLYFKEKENYNFENPFAKDIDTKTNCSFSCYNGAPIILGEGASPVVVGYDTTWAGSYTKDFYATGSAYEPNYEEDTVVVEKGEVCAVASETLPGGGFVLMSGTAFFSTFEVKIELENATTLQNSNYQMVMNIIEMVIPEPVITPIKDVKKAEMNKKFTIEGIVTSNASGYDKSTAFFDCIYVQDDTAGINLFPVDGNFKVGQKVRVSGVTSSYNGEIQLKVSKIDLVDDSITEIKPVELTNKEANSDKYVGSLIKVKGTVSKIGYASDGTLETIILVDEYGDEARVFIDGYIMSDYKGLDTIAVGAEVSAIGLGSITVDTESAEEVFIHRIRVRNRSEVVILKEAELVLGDPDRSGTVDMKDVVLIQRHIAKIEEISNLKLADVNNDGDITMVDVVELQRFIASMDVEYPIGKPVK